MEEKFGPASCPELICWKKSSHYSLIKIEKFLGPFCA
jgi:hypothetical protein